LKTQEETGGLGLARGRESSASYDFWFGNLDQGAVDVPQGDKASDEEEEDSEEDEDDNASEHSHTSHTLTSVNGGTGLNRRISKI
jgi:hypothetical protein